MLFGRSETRSWRSQKLTLSSVHLEREGQDEDHHHDDDDYDHDDDHDHNHDRESFAKRESIFL